jgi:cell division protein FtsN
MRCKELRIAPALAITGAFLVLMSCGKKEQNAQETLLPTVTAIDTLPAVPLDTATTIEQEIKPQIVSSPEGEYTVQVSSWQTKQKAEKEAQRFRAEGYEAYVQTAFLEDRRQTWYRVRIGRFERSEDAALMVNQIRDLLQSGYWIDRVKDN